MSSDLQWRRYAEAIFTNFESGLVTRIQSALLDDQGKFMEESLRIVFEYSKNDDQGFNTPNGSITIYGMSEETFLQLGDRMKCEVELRAGYLESKQNAPAQLFYAVLMDKSFEIQQGMSVATFKVLGNFLNKEIQGKFVNTEPQSTILDVLKAICIKQNMDLDLYLPILDKEITDQMQNFIANKQLPYPYSFSRTVGAELERVRQAFGITYVMEATRIVYYIHNGWVQWYIDKSKEFSEGSKKQVDTTLVAENKTAKKADASPIKTKTKVDLIKTTALVLNADTGLIGSPVLSTEITTKQYNDALAEGEVVWEKKYSKVVIDKKTGKPKVDKKTQQVKMTKQPKKFKVARRTVTAKAFINHLVDFNTMITLTSKASYCDGTYRVRSVKFKGDTNGTDWHMELELNE